MMPLPPFGLDLSFCRWLSGFLGRWQMFDVAVESAIRHSVLGGIWFAAALFHLWSRSGKDSPERYRFAAFTILTSTVAIVLVLGINGIVLRTPPQRLLAALYPNYLLENPNRSSFPSMSAALYGSLATLVVEADVLLGSALWAALVLVVALPRMYLGGHFLTDVLAGMAIGVLAYVVARPFDQRYGESFGRWQVSHGWFRSAMTFLTFLWLWQVAVEFRDADWLQRSLRLTVSRIAGSAIG